MREQARQQGGVVAHMTAIVARMEKRFGVSFTALRRWALKGGWAVVDQGLFSGANFLVNILLARWLPPEEYGAFAVALSVFYLLAGFHTALLTEPMMVFGPGKFKHHLQDYLGALFYGHWLIVGVGGLFLGLVAIVMRRSGALIAAHAFAALAISFPFLLLLWFARRGCYIYLRPYWAATGSVVYFITTLGGLVILYNQRMLSPFSALVLLGVVSGISSGLLLVAFVRPKVFRFPSGEYSKYICQEHLQYGKWALVGFSSQWFSSQVMTVLVASVLGLSASGLVAAVWNVFAPINLSLNVIGLLLLPVFARWNAQGLAVSEIISRSVKITFAIGGIVGFYSSFVTLFSNEIFSLLYRDKFQGGNVIILVAVAGIAISLFAAMRGIIAFLKTYGRVKLVAGAYLVGAMVLFASGGVLLQMFQVAGALMATVFSYLATFVVLYWHGRTIRSEGA